MGQNFKASPSLGYILKLWYAKIIELQTQYYKYYNCRIAGNFNSNFYKPDILIWTLVFSADYPFQ